eukprot:COSAG05_NODE_3007_length_2419_cov_2.225000_1_plen_300_part_00
MNIILFAPALFVLLAVETGASGAAWRIIMCGAIQITLGLPFLLADAKGYLGASFNLSRVFKHKWSVNFRWVPCTPLPPEAEGLLVDCDGPFTSKVFGLGLLSLMVVMLTSFGHARWCCDRGGLWATISGSVRGRAARGFSAEETVTMLFMSNLIGVACARSLHFQFYVWYYHSLPWLLWHGTRLPTLARLLLLGTIELCWNPWVGESSSPESAVRPVTASTCRPPLSSPVLSHPVLSSPPSSLCSPPALWFGAHIIASSHTNRRHGFWCWFWRCFVAGTADSLPCDSARCIVGRPPPAW